MLEKFVAALLVPYLSKYVENIDEGQLRIDLWSGKASLQDLVLKASVLDELLDPVDAQGKRTAGAPRLPVHIHRGLCKRVSLHIPLKHLRSQPVVLEVDELLLTLRGANNDNSDSAAAADVVRSKAERWEAVRVQNEAALDAFERARQQQKQQQQQQKTGSGGDDEDDGGSDVAAVTSLRKKGFFTRLGEIIVNNIVVKVRTVHVRYEEEQHDTIAGAILADVQLLTVDERTGQATFTDATGMPCMHKRLCFAGLQVYCEDARRMAALRASEQCWCTRMTSWQTWYHAMRQRVRDGDVSLSTLAGPASGSVEAHLVFKKYMASMPHTPYARVAVTLEHMLARLTRSQYVTLAQTASRLTNWSNVATLPVRRPAVPVHGHAREWWQYATRVVRRLCAAPRHAQLRERFSRASMPAYMQLFHDKLRAPDGLTPAQDKAYRFLVRYMTVPSMIAARKALYARVAVELQRLQSSSSGSSSSNSSSSPAGRRLQQQEPRAKPVGTDSVQTTVTAPPPRRTGGWWGWLRGANDKAATTTTATAASDGDEDAAAAAAMSEVAMLRQLAREYGIDDADVSGGGDNDDDAGDDATGNGDAGAAVHTHNHTTAAAAAAASAAAHGSGDVATSAEQHAKAVSSQKLLLPPSYRWLSLVVRVPVTSCRLELSSTEQLTLHTHQVYAAVDTFNAPQSMQVVARVQRLTISNPLATTTTSSLSSSSCGALVENLVETVDVTPASSSTSSSSSTAATAALVQSYLVVTDKDAAECAAASSTPPPPQQQPPPLLYVCGALHPVAQPLPDTHVDVALRVHLLPLRIVLDVTLLQRLIAWFTLPANVTLSQLTAHTRQAATRVARGSAATLQLREAMAKAQGLCIAIDVHAPVLLLPRALHTPRRHMSTLVVSFGQLWCNAQPLSELEKRRRVARGRADAQALYYTHTAALQQLYVELTTLEAALRRRPAHGMLLLSEVAMAAEVLQRITTDDKEDKEDEKDEAAVSRERVIVRLRVPQLLFACSHAALQLLASMAHTWTAAAAAATTTTPTRKDAASSRRSSSSSSSLPPSPPLLLLPGGTSHTTLVRTTAGPAAILLVDGGGVDVDDAAYTRDAVAAAVLQCGGASNEQTPATAAIAATAATSSSAHGSNTPFARLRVSIEHLGVHLLENTSSHGSSSHSPHGAANKKDDNDHNVAAAAAAVAARDGDASDEHTAMAAVLQLRHRRHDDSHTRARLVRYALSVLGVDVAAAVSSSQRVTVSLLLKTMSVVDTTWTRAPVLSGVGGRVDVLLPSPSSPETTTTTTMATATTTLTDDDTAPAAAATEVWVTLDGGSAVRIGTPLLNLVEAVVRARDVVMRAMTATTATKDDGTTKKQQQQQQQHAASTPSRPLRVVARIDGTLTVVLLDNAAVHLRRCIDEAATAAAARNDDKTMATTAAVVAAPRAAHTRTRSARHDVEVLFIAVDTAALSLQQQQQQQQQHDGSGSTVMLLRASVASVTVRAAEATRLATAHRILLRHSNNNSNNSNTNSNNGSNNNDNNGNNNNGNNSDSKKTPQLSLILRQSDAAARPRFRPRHDTNGSNNNSRNDEDDEGNNKATAPPHARRALVNGEALRYDNALQLQLTSTTAVLDVHTLQMLNNYFAYGLLARLTQVAAGSDDKSRNNGSSSSSGTSDNDNKDESSALFGVQVDVVQSTLLLPSHPHKEASSPSSSSSASSCFALVMDRLTVRKSVHIDSAEEHVTVDVRVHSVQRQRAHPRHRDGSDAHSAVTLLASPWLLQVHVRVPLDEHDVHAMRYVDVRSDGDDVVLRVSSDDVIALAALAHNNLTGEPAHVRDAAAGGRTLTHHDHYYYNNNDNDDDKTRQQQQKKSSTDDDKEDTPQPPLQSSDGGGDKEHARHATVLLRSASLPEHATVVAKAHADEDGDDDAVALVRTQSAQLGEQQHHHHRHHDEDGNNNVDDADDGGVVDDVLECTLSSRDEAPGQVTVVRVFVARLCVGLYNTAATRAAVMAAAPVDVASGAASTSQCALCAYNVAVLLQPVVVVAAAADEHAETTAADAATTTTTAEV